MSDRKNVRTAISELVRAGKSINAIINDLGTSRSTVLRVKRWLAVGKGPQVSPRKRTRTTLTPRVIGGLKKRIKSGPDGGH